MQLVSLVTGSIITQGLLQLISWKKDVLHELAVALVTCAKNVLIVVKCIAYMHAGYTSLEQYDRTDHSICFDVAFCLNGIL